MSDFLTRLNALPTMTPEQHQTEWEAQRARSIKYASDNAADFLRYAIANVNEQLGEGAAQRFPAVVAALVEASALGMIDIPEPEAVSTLGIEEALVSAGRDIRDALIEVSGLSSAIANAAEMIAEVMIDRTSKGA